MDMIFNCGKQRIGMLGLTFKSGTDDLRESPYVDMAETLIGKGYKLKIHDENVEIARLVGANAKFINTRLPHVSGLLSSIEDVMNESEVLVVCNPDPKHVQAVSNARPEQLVIDLSGVKAADSRAANIKGIAW